MTIPVIATIVDSLGRCRDLDDLTQIIRDSALPLLSADEIVVDITSPALQRPALVRINGDEAWAKLYNEKFHRLNPATSALRNLLSTTSSVVRRFEDLCPEPLFETRFYQEYMRPQRHRHSLIGVMTLEPAGSLAPILTWLVVRYDDRPPFDDDTVATLQILLTASAWGIHCAMRASDVWAASIIKSVFAVAPKLAEVALLVSKGLSNKDLAERLGITLGTAKHYVHQVLEATGASSRTDLTRMLR